MTPFSPVALDACDLPGLRKAVEILRDLENRAGSTAEARIRHGAYKHARELIAFETGAAEKHALLALQMGSEVADLGRSREEGPRDGTQDDPSDD